MRTLGLIAAVAAVLGCSGSSTNSDTGTTTGSTGGGTVCVPGQSVACVGVGGCQGGQVCASDGKSYGACQCGSGTSVSATSSSGFTSGATGTTSGTSTTTSSSSSSGGSTTGGGTTPFLGAMQVGASDTSAGQAYEIALTLDTAGLPGNPMPIGTVSVNGQFTQNGVSVALSGTYTTGTTQLAVNGIDATSTSWVLTGTLTGNAIEGTVTAGGQSGSFAGLLVPPDGPVSVFCLTSVGEEAVDAVISSNGSVIGLFADTQSRTILTFLDTALTDGGVLEVPTQPLPSTAATFVASDGGFVLQGGAGFTLVQPTPNGC